MLLRLGYLVVSNVFAVLRLQPMGDRNKDVEILALRHQIAVLERQLGGRRVHFTAADWALRAALLHRLRRHRDLIASRHFTRSRTTRPGRPAPCVRSAS